MNKMDENHRRTSVLKERTKEEQRYCKLGGNFFKNNGRDHLVVAESTNYQWKFFYINRGMEHNVARYAQYYIFYRTSKTSTICSFSK